MFPCTIYLNLVSQVFPFMLLCRWSAGTLYVIGPWCKICNFQQILVDERFQSSMESEEQCHWLPMQILNTVHSTAALPDVVQVDVMKVCRPATMPINLHGVLVLHFDGTRHVQLSTWQSDFQLWPWYVVQTRPKQAAEGPLMSQARVPHDVNLCDHMFLNLCLSKYCNYLKLNVDSVHP